MSVTVVNADVMDGLRSLESDSVQCCVTSPPYWGLRDYGTPGQIGLEKTPAEFVARLVEVFEEVRRVLKPGGVCFVNLGDSYAGGKTGNTNGGASSGLKQDGRDEGGRQITNAGFAADMGGMSFHKPLPPGLKPKDLVGIPWRVAFALQDAGWWLRQDIIWHKPNPMPESVTDRCTKSHEYIFLLTKSARYFWDAEAISETAIHAGQIVVLGEKSLSKGQANGANVSASGNGTAASVTVKDTRNKRSVWTIATAPFAEAHFATFPPGLPEICIRAGSKPGDTVLDPFGGAGTTGLVADRLQRNAILIELNPQYAAMASKRVATDRGGLLDLMEA